MFSCKSADDGLSFSEAAEISDVFENCGFRDITLKGFFLNMNRTVVKCDAIELCGFDEPGHELRNIEFANVTLGDPEHPTTQTLSLRLCESISFKNIKCY